MLNNDNRKSRKNYSRTYVGVSRNTKKQSSKKPPIVTGYINNSTGHKLDNKTRKRLESYYIPPAYNNDNILIAKSPNNKVQVICEDTAGRKQYIYHPQYLAGKERRKYNKLTSLAKHAYHIERDARTAIIRLANRRLPSTSQHIPYTKDELIQIVIYMLITYHFRIGSREYDSQYGSTGISTLRPKHIHFNSDNNAHIQFKGKKSVINRCDETWQPAITVIKRLCTHHLPAVNESVAANNKSTDKHRDMVLDHKTKLDIVKDNQYIFSYLYTNPISNKQLVSIIDSQDVACYIASKYGDKAIISPKMFRTWYANYYMLEFMRNLSSSTTSVNIKVCDILAKKENIKDITPKQCTAWLKREIPIYVSRHLNNTPTVCKSDYINNKLFSEIITRPDYYRKRILAATTPIAIHKLVGTLLSI